MDIIKCIMTNNDCYQIGRKIKPIGVMVHSTGANNQNIRRYVQPSKDDKNYAELSKIIGKNKYANDWNRSGVKKCTHGFIGLLADGSVGFVQTLPWDMRGWHSGSGSSGKSANDTHISFEICEDDLSNKVYFDKVYNLAVEVVAYLCELYKLDPLADGVVICHSEGYRRGIASGHADVEHWFPKFDKTMDDFRQDVNKLMSKEYNIVSNVNILNMRKGVGTNCAVVGVIKDKAPHTIVAESTGRGAKLWGQLKENNYWIALDYTERTNEEAVNLVQGKVTAKAGLNVRSGPGTQYDKVKTLKYGDIVNILSEQNGWGEIGENQWVSMQYIKKV